MKRAPAGLGIVVLLVMWAAVPASAQLGERPRDTDNTEAAEEAIEDAEDADDDAERRMHYQTALASAQAAITEDANNPAGHRLAALASLGLEQYAEAGKYFDRAMELYPLYEFEDQPLRERTWMDLYQTASPLVSSGDYDGAAAVFEGAHAIYSGRPEAMITLGQLYAQLGEHDRSIEYMDEVAVFMASDVLANFDSATVAGWQDQVSVLGGLRAQVLSAAGRLPEAAAAYRELSDSDPSNLEYGKGLASVLMEMGNEAEALEVYEDLLSRPGLSGQDYYAIGIGFYQANDYERAVRAFGGAAEQNSRDRDALEMWARSLSLDSVYVDVPPVAERWIELDPYSQNGYVLLAQAANQNGDTERTQEAMATAQALEVNVDQLQLQKFNEGGGVVSGSVINKTLEAGASVTLRFTFYGTSDNPIGSVTAAVTVGAANMAEIFRAQFDSGEIIGGYSYELTVG